MMELMEIMNSNVNNNCNNIIIGVVIFFGVALIIHSGACEYIV